MLYFLLPSLVAAEEAPMWRRALAVLGGADKFLPTEWNNMTFAERLTNYDWTKELLIVLTLLLYVSSHWYGVRKNKQKVDAWMDAARPVLESQFAEVGVSVGQELIKDSTTQYTTYATGRLNIESLHVDFNLIDRHNIILQSIALFFPSVRSVDGLRDNVEVIITPMDSSAVDPVILGIVNKEVLQLARDENYYLSLTRTSDSKRLGSSLAFMTEHNDAIESLFTPALESALVDGSDVLEYFALTDQSRDAPKDIKDISPRPRVRLAFRYPRNVVEQEHVAKVLDAAINYVDFLVSKATLKVEATRKIKATREAEISKLKKKEETAKLEDLQLKKAEERRKAESEFASLSEKEQRRALKKQQEKQARKEAKKRTQRT